MVGLVSILEPSSEYVPLVAVDTGDWLTCETLIDSFLVGSSGIGSLGWEWDVVGMWCVAAIVVEECILGFVGGGKGPVRYRESVVKDTADPSAGDLRDEAELW